MTVQFNKEILIDRRTYAAGEVAEVPDHLGRRLLKAGVATEQLPADDPAPAEPEAEPADDDDDADERSEPDAEPEAEPDVDTDDDADERSEPEAPKPAKVRKRKRS